MYKLDALGAEMRMGAPLLVSREIQTDETVKESKIEEKKVSNLPDYEEE